MGQIDPDPDFVVYPELRGKAEVAGLLAAQPVIERRVARIESRNPAVSRLRYGFRTISSFTLNVLICIYFHIKNST